MAVKISSQFDGGNILVQNLQNPEHIELAIRQDNASDFYQWFYYRVQGVAGQPLRMHLTNAAGAAYPDGWPGYQAVASYDRNCWFRVPTCYIDGELIIEHQPEQASIYYAYFAPYSYEQHLNLLAGVQSLPGCELLDLGSTLDGRDINLLKIGTSSDYPIWITARQHPGESMSEWLVEGLLKRLLDRHDPLAAALREQATFWIVPNMNPDGSVRGHLRTNAAGVNLNREWQAPSKEKSPEVYWVREKMQATGVKLYLDIHGDEALPCNFIAGQAGAPHVSDALLAAEQTFKENLRRVSPDFQLERGYPPGKFGPQTLSIASFWVGQAFNCPAMTLEMPFKDHDLRPCPHAGWSPERSARLGAALLNPIADWLASR